MLRSELLPPAATSTSVAMTTAQATGGKRSVDATVKSAIPEMLPTMSSR